MAWYLVKHKDKLSYLYPVAYEPKDYLSVQTAWKMWSPSLVLFIVTEY
jgi:hypothetical protein